MDSGKKIESVHLWTSSQSLWIETPDKSLPIVAISRDWNPEITLTNHAAIPSGATKKSVYGILGIIHLPLTKFLVTVVQKRKVGDLDGHAIFRLESVEFIPISSMQASSSTEVDGEKRCYQLIHEALSTPYFYFTYTGDLTNSQQRQAQSNSNSSWENADKRFLWNYSMANNLMSYVSSGSSKSDIYPFLLQLIHGAVFIHRCSINGKSFNWGLISRRSRFQTGTRFFARGTDKQGNVANYCETEQLVEFEGQLASYVQTRGSMPFFWSQMPCVKYMPKPKVIGSDHDNKSVMTAHFEEQTSVYGEQVIINLINQKKNEGTLEQMFRQLMSNLKMDNVHYEAFDFHKECSKMRYDRLILLRNQISQYVFGYFQKSGSSVSTTQKGVFRTNCMDCLDRTNVVQAYIAIDVLAKILSTWGILSSHSVAELERNESFLQMYRNSWADHANLISVQYAGTGALKTDFTRTGVRTHWGLLQDGWNSAIRYVRNNYRDGNRTDSIKFILGELSTKDVLAGEKLKRENAMQENESKLQYLPHLLLGLVLLLLLCLLASPRLSMNMITLILILATSIYGTVKFITANHVEFVNYPTSYVLSRSNKKQI